MTIVRRHLFVLTTLAVIGSGCVHPPAEVHYLGEEPGAPLEYYKDVATQINYPTVQQETPASALSSLPPRTVRDRTHDDIRELSLIEAIHTALQNSQIIATRAQFRAPGNPLYNGIDRNSAIFDPAIQETNTGLSIDGLGVEAALAAFDAQLRSSMTWSRNESVQNNILLSGGLRPGNELVSEAGRFRSELSKVFANGDQFSVSQDWDYTGNNLPLQLFPSSYRGVAKAEYRHPLLAGAGTEYTRVLGPISRTLPGFEDTQPGVVIARINNDISIARFETTATLLCKDVEDAYWELYLAYRTYHGKVVAREATLKSWRSITRRREEGARGGSATEAARAEALRWAAVAQADAALAALYVQEVQLRRLMGIAVNDGTILRPAEEPVTALLEPEWQSLVVDGLMHRPELRMQKWEIKALELQLEQSRSLLKPRLDFVAGYQVNGFGDDLFGNNGTGTAAEQFHSAYATLFDGNQTGWNLGFEFNVALGQRAAHARTTNYELKLRKARHLLARQEQEVVYEIATSVQAIQQYHQSARTSFNGMNASARELAAIQREYEAGRVPFDAVVVVQDRLAQAELAYYSALVRYNQSITDVYYRTGTLLSQSNVYLAEGGWACEAYEDAYERARARTNALPNNHLEDSPQPFTVPFGALPPFGDVLVESPPMDVPLMDVPAVEAASPGTAPIAVPPAVMPPSPASPTEPTLTAPALPSEFDIPVEEGAYRPWTRQNRPSATKAMLDDVRDEVRDAIDVVY